jgi:hypothetical protein
VKSPDSIHDSINDDAITKWVEVEGESKPALNQPVATAAIDFQLMRFTG